MGIRLSEIRDKKLRALIKSQLARSGYSEPKRDEGTESVRRVSVTQGLVDIDCPLLVRIIRVVRSKSGLYDDQNLSGGAKQLQDAIAAALSRKSDSATHGLWWEYRQEIGEPEIRIEIFSKE